MRCWSKKNNFAIKYIEPPIAHIKSINKIEKYISLLHDSKFTIYKKVKDIIRTAKRKMKAISWLIEKKGKNLITG